jgi:hypothetical protein
MAAAGVDLIDDYQNAVSLWRCRCRACGHMVTRSSTMCGQVTRPAHTMPVVPLTPVRPSM